MEFITKFMYKKRQDFIANWKDRNYQAPVATFPTVFILNKYNLLNDKYDTVPD